MNKLLDRLGVGTQTQTKDVPEDISSFSESSEEVDSELATYSETLLDAQKKAEKKSTENGIADFVDSLLPQEKQKQKTTTKPSKEKTKSNEKPPPKTPRTKEPKQKANPPKPKAKTSQKPRNKGPSSKKVTENSTKKKPATRRTRNQTVSTIVRLQKRKDAILSRQPLLRSVLYVTRDMMGRHDIKFDRDYISEFRDTLELLVNETLLQAHSQTMRCGNKTMLARHLLSTLHRNKNPNMTLWNKEDFEKQEEFMEVSKFKNSKLYDDHLLKDN